MCINLTHGQVACIPFVFDKNVSLTKPLNWLRWSAPTGEVERIDHHLVSV